MKFAKRRPIIYFALISLSTIFYNCQSNQNQTTRKPNIIYILADDLGYGDLSIYGQTNFETPHIDKLAQDGLRFTQHYSGSTVCAPSRSSLMTGMHTGHTAVRGNKEIKPEGQAPLPQSEITIAELLQEAGYKTGAFGKWGLGFPGSEGDPNNQGFEQFYGYNCQRMGHNYYPNHLWNNNQQEFLSGNENSMSNDYAPELIHEAALDFIEENKDEPFFLYYPSIIPHAELVAPEKYMEEFRGKFLPEKVFEGVDEGEGFRTGAYGTQKESHAAFAAMVRILDNQVGEIRNKVEELGIAENTIIIFTSDNGPHLEGGADPDYFKSYGQLRGYKRDLFEGGIRVPLIAFWPETIKANSISNHISAFWDFMPTVCGIAGIDIPNNIDGISYLSTLLDESQKIHKYLYWEFHEQGGKQAVRINNWKGIRLNMAKDPNAEIAIYNLDIDIQEENNLALEYPEIVKEMAKVMDQEHIRSNSFPFPFEL